MPSSNSSSPPRGPSERTRSVVSLLLTLHLIVLAFALSGNFLRSPLQSRVLAVLRPYAQTLNFELDFLPYQLTHATAADVDHRIEVLPADADPDQADAWRVLPDRGFRGGERYKRYQRLARLMGYLADEDASGNGLSMIGRGVAENFVMQRGIRTDRIRCRRHMLQDWESVQGGTAQQRNPNDPSYFRVVYAANTIVSDNGRVSLLKISDVGEVAQPNKPEN